MNHTAFLLMARYDGLPVIPVDVVCRDYFRHLTVEKFLRKVLAGEIALPIVRMEGSQKAAKGVPLTDLADYLDKQMALARKECEQLSRGAA
jgi:Pyocin activator protein PrtN